jgi:hypothetical protein
VSIFNDLFGKRLFKPQPDDVKMAQATAQLPDSRPHCSCLLLGEEGTAIPEPSFHIEQQDTECEGWKRLEALVDKAAKERAKKFAPGLEMPRELWRQVITLPDSIAQLKSVKELYLYSSHLVRIPPVIGEMESLENFDVYTSYRLHWMPYEITRCHRLRRSRVSTRALYGNFRYRPPFPSLAPKLDKVLIPSECSVCRSPLPVQGMRPYQVWISLEVATDVMPLLVNACSGECIRKLPAPASNHVSHPHKGGCHLIQPQTSLQRILSSRSVGVDQTGCDSQ